MITAYNRRPYNHNAKNTCPRKIPPWSVRTSRWRWQVPIFVVTCPNQTRCLSLPAPRMGSLSHDLLSRSACRENTNTRRGTSQILFPLREAQYAPMAGDKWPTARAQGRSTRLEKGCSRNAKPVFVLVIDLMCTE